MTDEPETIEELLESLIGQEIEGIEIDSNEQEIILALTSRTIVLGGRGLYLRQLSPDPEFLN